MAEGREWYPADWVDETCPPAMASPDGFIVVLGNGFQLGYVAGSSKSGRGKFAREYAEIYNRPLAIGAVVNFLSCDRYADVEATINRKGSYVVHGTIPSDHNTVIVDGEIDTLHESFEALIAAIKQPGDDLWIFENDEDEKRVTLSFSHWSDPEPYLFDVVEGKPCFRLVPTQKN